MSEQIPGRMAPQKLEYTAAVKICEVTTLLPSSYGKERCRTTGMWLEDKPRRKLEEFWCFCFQITSLTFFFQLSRKAECFPWSGPPSFLASPS